MRTGRCHVSAPADGRALISAERSPTSHVAQRWHCLSSEVRRCQPPYTHNPNGEARGRQRNKLICLARPQKNSGQAESTCIGTAADGSGCTGPSSSSARASLSTLSMRSLNCCRRSCVCRVPRALSATQSQAAHIARTSTVAAVAALSCSNAATSCSTPAIAACVSARLGKAKHCLRSIWRAGAGRVELQTHSRGQPQAARRAPHTPPCACDRGARPRAQP